MTAPRLTVSVEVGDGAVMEIADPAAFADGGPEWIMRYGNPEAIRLQVAELLASYDYLLSDEITMKEATRRLGLMRYARRKAQP